MGTQETFNPSSAPWITISELHVIRASSTSIKIVIKIIGGLYTPIVFSDRHELTCSGRVILDGDKIMASPNLEELIDGLHQILSPQTEIVFPPRNGSSSTLH